MTHAAPLPRSRLEDEVASVLGPGGVLAGAMDGYEDRAGQLGMALRVARALEDDERLLVEAGTGTGKTLAYLVPAILSGRKVVVSTGTKTLQDQIARLDLPRLARILPRRFGFTVMKGLGNYLCLRRFHDHARQLALVDEGPGGMSAVRAWMAETDSGDRADLTGLPDDAPVWREITATPETRLGSRCPYFDRCFVTHMRRRAQDAQIVLVNHHLYFADLALRARWPEAEVVPPHEAVIFDEAHQIEDVATEFFGQHVSTQRLYALARDLGRVSAGGEVGLRTASLARRVEAVTHALASALRARLPDGGAGAASPSDELRVAFPDDLWAPGPDDDGPLARYHDLDNILDEAGAFLDRLSREDPAAPAAPVWSGLARRAEAIRQDLGEMVESTAERDRVRWVASTPRSLSLRASPIDVAPALARALGGAPRPVVFTSATLTAGGAFDYVRGRLGLGDTAEEVAFPSPFRFREQALLYLAPDLPDPGGDAFPQAAAERALDLVRASRGRALLLFTSFRNLRVAAERLRADGAFPVLVQGERPRHALLDQLKTRVGSVLLATQSFWEGVDVPGEALSLLLVDRLPFAVPADPLTAARIERIRESGGDPFASYQLPRAALALKQGFGRLIRTRRDRGVAAILDGRILRRTYGATLLASLPRECARTESLDDVARFFAEPE